MKNEKSGVVIFLAAAIGAGTYLEKHLLATCHTVAGDDPYTNACSCPSSGSCHPNNSSLTVTAYSDCASSCSVNVSARWSCNGYPYTAPASLWKSCPDGSHGQVVGSSNNWTFSGSVTCPCPTTEGTMTVYIQLDSACGSCTQTSILRRVYITCSPGCV